MIQEFVADFALGSALALYILKTKNVSNIQLKLLFGIYFFNFFFFS